MKAVVIRFSSLGDVVLATAPVEALHRAGWEIGFVTKPQYAPLFLDDNRISQIFEFNGILSTAQKIRSFKPDWVIDLQRTGRSMILSGLLGAKVIRTTKWSLERRLLVGLGKGDRTPKSVVDAHLAALARLGISHIGALPKVFPTSKGLSFAHDFIGHIKKPIAAIHPGAKHSLKNWGNERFLRLSEILAEQGFSVIIISDELPLAYPLPVQFTGQLSLEELVGILAHSDLFIGNDSGPVHIASALEVPSLSIFGPTHPSLGFAPRGKYAAYITEDVACSPCTLHGDGACKFDKQKCFDSLTSELVAKKAIEIFKSKYA